jgi:3-oxoadipate enol-lactonase
MNFTTMDPADFAMSLAAEGGPMVDALLTNECSLELMGAYTAWEAALRRTYEKTQQAWWQSFGVATQQDVLRTREKLAAADAGALTHRSVPISWHEGGRGPTVLLINGWTASGVVWPQSLVERLERQFRVIRVDNRGTGWSRTAPTPFTIGDLAKDAAGVLRATDTASAIVVGMSMGGMVGQELTLRYPDLVSRLVIVASQPPAPKRIPAPPRVLRGVISPGRHHNVREWIRLSWGQVCGPGFVAAHPEAIDELIEQVVRRPTPRALVFQQLRAISSWIGADRLARITTPTVVVHGDADPLTPVGNGMRVAQLIPGARYVELPGVGHLMPLEAADTLAEIIEAKE